MKRNCTNEVNRDRAELGFISGWAYIAASTVYGIPTQLKSLDNNFST